MRFILAICASVILSVPVINAQSNRKVNLQELGLSFEIPNGWSGGIKDDLYLLGHSSIPGLMVLSENKARSAKALKALALEGITAEGIQLSPKGEFKLKANDRVEGFYEGTFNGNLVRVFSIGLINNLGSGMNISILTEKGKFSNVHIREAEKLARSVRFFRSKDSPETAFWKRRIVGKKLKYMHTRGSATGQSQTVIINLYNNGNFNYYSSSTVTISGSSLSGNDSNEGQFKIYSVGKQSVLELYFPNKTLEFDLTVSKNKRVYLNGSRYFVVPIE